MKRDQLIPKPESIYMKVKCGKCGNEQIVFDRISLEVKCNVCDEILAVPRGGKAEIKGETLQILG
jgi:small subunit ribosomal protein S27e